MEKEKKDSCKLRWSLNKWMNILLCVNKDIQINRNKLLR